MAKIKKAYCPVADWSCSYYRHKDGSCKLVHEGCDPFDECDDFAAFYEADEEHFIWVDEDIADIY